MASATNTRRISGAAIRVATDFLEPDTVLNRELIHLLFLFRQAGADGVQLEITALVICALLERLVRLIFKAVCNGKSNAPDVLDEAKFEKLRHRYLVFSAQVSSRNREREYNRFHRSIKRNSLLEMQDIFKAVSQQLNIPWHKEMEPIYSEWKGIRHASAHGKFRHDVAPGFEQQAAEETFFGISRIAGGFNMIFLKLFGYSGRYLSSATEGTHRVIETNG